jgi:hypothetical protein
MPKPPRHSGSQQPGFGGEPPGIHPTSTRGRAGFTFVEIVVALSIGAFVITAAVMAYGAINSFGVPHRSMNVNIGIANAFAFYNQTASPEVSVGDAPNFAAAAMAGSLRERFLRDISSATAVVCLPRTMASTAALRFTNLVIPTNLDARTLVSPDSFRTNLIDPGGAIFTNFSSSTNLVNGSTLTPKNLSIYVLYSAANPTNITVDAIYESDWVNVTNSPTGVYASVRRYVGTNMTEYYHVFYPGPTNNLTNRPAASFFTKNGTTTGAANYRKAEGRPFYFVWWPDPMSKSCVSPYPSESTSPSSARADYMLHSGASSYFFVLPAFPAL